MYHNVQLERKNIYGLKIAPEGGGQKAREDALHSKIFVGGPKNSAGVGRQMVTLRHWFRGGITDFSLSEMLLVWSKYLEIGGDKWSVKFDQSYFKIGMLYDCKISNYSKSFIQGPNPPWIS